MSFRQICEKCGHAAPVTPSDLYQEGYSTIYFNWNRNQVHGGPEIHTWHLCWECTLQIREFTGIPREGDTHTREATASLDSIDYDAPAGWAYIQGAKVPRFKGDPFDWVDRQAYDEVAGSAAMHAGPIDEAEFYAEVARREDELRRKIRTVEIEDRPVDFHYKTAFNEVYDSLTSPAEPTYAEFQEDVLRRAAELRSEGSSPHESPPNLLQQACGRTGHRIDPESGVCKYCGAKGNKSYD